MSESLSEDPTPPRAAFTLDLSSGKSAAKAKRPKGFVPVVQQTINLTRKKTAGPDANSAPNAPAPAPDPRKADATPSSRRQGPPPAPTSRRRDDGRRHDGGRSDGRRDGGRRDDGDGRPSDAPRSSGGTGLADFLDAATLARLRGGA